MEAMPKIAGNQPTINEFARRKTALLSLESTWLPDYAASKLKLA